MNVVVTRGDIRKSLSGKSRCPKCKKNIRAIDLIPIISYALLRGRCRSCRKSISIKYPLAELMIGLFFVVEGAIILSSGSYVWLAIIQFILFHVFVYLAVFDLWHLEIPLYPSLLSLVIATVYQILSILHNKDFSFVWIFAVILPLVLVSSFARLYKKQVFGLGDLLIMLSVTIPLSYKQIFVSLETTLITGASVGIAVSVLGKSKLNNTIIPLVPFLVFGWLIGLTFGEKIWDKVF